MGKYLLVKAKSLILVLLMTIFEGAYAQLSPSPKHEVRAVWLATIGGIDWPRTKAHSPSSIEAQKRELTATLDRLKAANFNTVILQTRIRATVIYPSSIEPWDACLTGHANRSPGYDPLDFAVKECHKRGMQIHAWMVAFPANSLRAAGNLGSRALHRRHPELCMRTDDGCCTDGLREENSGNTRFPSAWAHRPERKRQRCYQRK